MLFDSDKPVETQQRYTQIEKELFAIQFGLQRFHQYVYGQRVTVETDHKPLLGIVKTHGTGCQELDAQVPVRRQRLPEGFGRSEIHANIQ